MARKIRLAFIYRTSNVFMSGKHFDNTYYHFHVDALQRNPNLDIKYFHGEKNFDTSILKEKFDIIQLWANGPFGVPDELTGIQDLDIPVISGVSDPVDAKNSIKYHKKWKINYYFHFYNEEFFYKLYPKNFKYKTIIFGLEPTIYRSVVPFNDRIKNRILLTGAIGNKKIFSRIINDIRRPKWNAYRYYYLRTKCSELSYVDYTPTLQHPYIGDRYPLLLQKYCASIASTNYLPNIKYWENAAAGCLTFMEVTKKNKADFLGYVDGETSIFINQNNYEHKFNEFLKDQENPKWETIAKNGREFTMKNLNNDIAVESLVELMQSLL